MSIRIDLLDTISARVRDIAVSRGYETDAGRRVYVGQAAELGPDDPATAIAIMLGETEITEPSQGFVQEEIDLELQALATGSADDPYRLAEMVAADLKRAVEQPDRTLGGLVHGQLSCVAQRMVPREEGVLTVGVAVLYRLRYLRRWGTV